jgi:ketosteroid isomerase-like protein
MRLIWFVVLVTALVSPDRERDRAALLAADGAHARSADFLGAFADDATYLHPGSPLVRGKRAIRALLDTATGSGVVTWTPEYADVSSDGTLGYTYGWTRLADQQGKYLACWRRKPAGLWRVTAYARTRMATGTTPPTAGERVTAPPVRGRADSRELLRADSTFAAMSVANGAKAAFLAFAADEAVTLGPPAAPMNHGRDAISATFTDFPADAVLEWAPVSADVAGSGDLGCTVGEATVTARHSFSKYLTVWKRQPDGGWKFVADGGNARPAP